MYIPRIDIELYNYNLKPEKIAKFPLQDRSQSKLLFINVLGFDIEDLVFKDIPNLLPENSFLVINDTKVIPARLYFTKPSGGKVELLLVEPMEPSVIPQITMQANKSCVWQCMTGGKNIKQGMLFNYIYETEETNINLKAKIIDRNQEVSLVEFEWNPDSLTFAEVLEITGKTPLPPYIKRDAVPSDKGNYQTVYAEEGGSVAAPTAGLHFTDEIMDTIRRKGIIIEKLTLHIGPGTFKPIEGRTEEHIMHSESFFITKKLLEGLNEALNEKKKIIAVGTTTVRTLESLYWLGVKLIKEGYSKFQKDEFFYIDQWEPYQDNDEFEKISAMDSLNAINKFLTGQDLKQFQARTKLFIVPEYKFRFIDGIITNFHMPKSTLILLVAAFIGDDLWKKAYDEALQKDYRFLSYGDATFCLK